MITIRTDRATAEIRRAMQRLSPEKVRLATRRAINRTIVTARSQYLKKAILKQYNTKATEVTQSLFIKKAAGDKLEARINANRKPISLARFNPRFDYNQGANTIAATILRRRGQAVRRDRVVRRGSTGNGVTFMVKKGKRERIAFAFMIRGGKAATTVFARGHYGTGTTGFIRRRQRVNKRGSDTPIQKMVTASMAGMADNPAVKRDTVADLTPAYNKRMLHELNHLINRGNV